MTSDSDNAVLLAMEQAATAVAAMTGIKRQFIDAGWNEHNAEKATIELLATSRGSA